MDRAIFETLRYTLAGLAAAEPRRQPPCIFLLQIPPHWCLPIRVNDLLGLLIIAGLLPRRVSNRNSRRER
ncbi:MAG: hypothetical protein DME25_14030 [Verrucomicrobia bacterium]|nr:MAG: hypothetical protein DME25_14030 [Verrucomicrobiota bacterium]